VVSFEKGLSAASVEEGFVGVGFAFVTSIVGLDAGSAASGTVGAGAEEEEEGPPLSVCCCSVLGVGVGVDDPDSFSSRRRRIYAYVSSQAESQHLNVRTWSIFSLSGASGGGGRC
jgi:hypothetical protein